MDLSKLFEMQKALDERIIKEHGLEGKDLLPNLILSLQVELGECANEWQGFKHWKVNPQPKEHMLEEYVDCLHFILSMGIKRNFHTVDFNYLHEHNVFVYKESSVLDQFNKMFNFVGAFSQDYDLDFYEEMFLTFIGLGELLGFTWRLVVQAYMEKNKVNHERQDNGY